MGCRGQGRGSRSGIAMVQLFIAIPVIVHLLNPTSPHNHVRQHLKPSHTPHLKPSHTPHHETNHTSHLKTATHHTLKPATNHTSQHYQRRPVTPNPTTTGVPHSRPCSVCACTCGAPAPAPALALSRSCADACHIFRSTSSTMYDSAFCCFCWNFQTAVARIYQRRVRCTQFLCEWACVHATPAHEHRHTTYSCTYTSECALAHDHAHSNACMAISMHARYIPDVGTSKRHT